MDRYHTGLIYDHRERKEVGALHSIWSAEYITVGDFHMLTRSSPNVRT